MPLKDELIALLPNRLSRIAAVATLAAIPLAIAAPPFASPLFPSATPAKIVVAQIILALSLALIGIIATLGFVLTHLKKIEASNREQAVLLNNEQEQVLLSVCNNEPVTVSALSKKNTNHQVILHHLEALKELDLLHYYWREEQWSLAPAGRAYLVSHKLIT